MASYRATDNYYREERDTYREGYGVYLRNEEVPLILKKLCKHYKARVPRVRFYGHSDSGSAGYGGLRLSNEPSMGLLIHEFGHYVKNSGTMADILKKVSNKGTHHHGLRFQTCIYRIHTWAKEKDYWRGQIKRRREKAQAKVKEKKVHEEKKKTDPNYLLGQKIKDTKKKIENKEAALNRYAKRLAYFKKLYGTKTKKANRSIGALKRALIKYEAELKSS